MDTTTPTVTPHTDWPDDPEDLTDEQWAQMAAEFAADQAAEYTYYTAHHEPGGPHREQKEQEASRDFGR